VRTTELDYDLDAHLVAQHPIEPRDAARLLVDRGPGATPADHVVADLPALLAPGDLLVVNTTRVLPARVAVRRPGGGSGEVLLLEDRGDGWWEALCRPSRKLAPGSTVTSVGGRLRFRMGDDLGSGRRLVRPATVPSGAAPSGEQAGGGGSPGRGPLDAREGVAHADFAGLLDALATDGEMPLPPYIHERLGDPERYQTTYARRPASAAAPTAGLHLTPTVLDGLRGVGVEVAEVELVVGLDTFRPVTAERLEDHAIHTEHYEVPASTSEAVSRTRSQGGRVVAVGTTTVRALESAARPPGGSGGGGLAAGGHAGRTDLFITPGFDFAAVDLLMTNFHLPRSSLLALVQAFAGPRWRDLYAVAAARRYRFLSFGDCMLLQRTPPDPTATGPATAAAQGAATATAQGSAEGSAEGSAVGGAPRRIERGGRGGRIGRVR
jgi:S-adenosylmethionine:tRNA ribosyltransferase-isomerase